MTIQSWLPQYQELVEAAIADFFDTRYQNTSGVESSYEDALRYAVLGGGKRLRPILTMLTYEYATGNDMAFWQTDPGVRLLRSIIGIELIHCYTLVHDDLPCMDNDEYRRGKLTVWRKYGEPMALLVGDSLQTMGYELLSLSGNARVITEMTRALGDIGVVRGQVRDTFLRHDTLTLSELLRIHDEKTGVFIAAALSSGVILGTGDIEQESDMRLIGFLLGRAFQIQDDILDAEGDASVVGKKTGKDAMLGKGIVALVGLPESKKILHGLKEELKLSLQGIGDTRFTDIVEYVISRKS